MSILPLVLKDVFVRRRGKRLLGPVSLSLAPGGCTIILGPNGSGKTTLLKVMHGVERISSGRVAWAVPDREARHHQGYVFQTPIMLRRSVGDNLRYPLQLRKTPKALVEAQVRDWAHRIGLQDRMTLPATRLSGGEKQRLALGRALIRRPEVLFLDEPCANLDGPSTRAIEALLQEAQDAGTRVIMTTHNFGQAKRLATDAIFMLDGAVRESGPAQAFFATPQTPELQAFFRGDIIG
ncbi:phosphate ABC transporter ATP-binding protein, PhoT family [Roseobacter denitrificans OCh 114]|uniref:Tungstate ABC transporter, ATP-binding protein n=2 Tax=Roseobacter denitrificans TaxID=2434 RepID=Q165A9_ROSDO|nr:tungstate ABC transporter, ATP-binding protein [Roseobacter denitrificans OCh 114]SFF81764.1 phosphate ABC transporter ATP-binding protein, PhoT family [Roseobacter denitrificans OCh 114]